MWIDVFQLSCLTSFYKHDYTHRHNCNYCIYYNLLLYILFLTHLSKLSRLVAIAEQIPLNTHAQYSYLLIAIRSKHMPHTNTARNSCLQKDTPLFSRQAIYKNKLYLFPTMNACNYNYNLVVFIITKQSIILLNMNY